MNIRSARRLAAAALTALLALTACSGADDAESRETHTPTATVEAEDVEDAGQADEVEQALLSTFGVDGFQELESTHWGYYIADVSTPNASLIKLTMQTDGDDPLVEGSSETAFSLIGGQFEDVNIVELVDGAGNHIEETRRRDVPLLN